MQVAAVVALLVCGAALIGLFLSSRSPAPVSSRVPAAATPAATERSLPDDQGFAARPRDREQTPAAAQTSEPDLAGEEYAKRRCVHLLGQQSAYTLSGEEVEALSQRYAHYQSVRGALELSIAKVSTSAGTLRVDIPSYPAAGAEMEQMMRHDFEQILGPDRGRGLWQLLDATIRDDFAQFGSATQAVAAAMNVSSSGEKWYRIRRSAEWLGPDGYRRSNGSDTRLPASEIAETDYIFLGPLLGQLGDPNKS